MTENNIPKYEFLSNEKYKNALLHIRDQCIPILENNLFPHYTDHSIHHSDRLVYYIDKLISPMLSGKELSDQELMILYLACYLHDIGMQYEKAGETTIIQELYDYQIWKDMPIEKKHGAIRDHHNKISAELVLHHIKELGIHLDNDVKPEYVACLCDAHCLDTDSEDYNALMACSPPNIRLRLLSGLLRMADILDESSKRANLNKSKSLDLDVYSQMHWWRSYYTEEVHFDIPNRTVDLYFNFPKQKNTEYEKIIPELQVPEIQSEFSLHTKELNKIGLGWSVEYKILEKPYDFAEEMPDQVYLEMCNVLQKRKVKQHQISQTLILDSIKQAQPIIKKKLDNLLQNSSTPRDLYLRELWEIAKEFEKVESIRSAWSVFIYDYEKYMSHLPDKDQIEMGLWVSEVLTEDKCYKRAYEIISKITPLAENVDDPGLQKEVYVKQVQVLKHIYTPDEFYDAYKRTLPFLGEKDSEHLQANASEYFFLMGHLDHLERIFNGEKYDARNFK